MNCITPPTLDWNDPHTLRSTAYGDLYFSNHDGIAESTYVFLQGNHLPERFASKPDFIIAETGFGTGLNFFLTVQHFQAQQQDALLPPHHKLHYISFEKHPLSGDDLVRAMSRIHPDMQHLAKQLQEVYPPAIAGLHQIQFTRNIQLTLAFGDASEQLPQTHFLADAWFLDGFAPSLNPDMWSDKLFQAIAQHTATTGTFATFTAAGFVRRALIAQGFDARKIKGFGRKREMLVGQFTDKPNPINQAKPWFSLPRPIYAPSSDNQQRVAVVGAGIAGCAAADAFASAGYQVDIFDPQPPAFGASGNHAGVYQPQLSLQNTPQTRWYTQASLLTQRTLDSLAHRITERAASGKLKHPELIGQPWFAHTGAFHAAGTEKIASRFKKIAEKKIFPNEILRWVKANESPELVGLPINIPGLWISCAGWVRPPFFCKALLEHDQINLHSAHINKIAYHQTSRTWSLFTPQNELVSHAQIVILANAIVANEYAQTSWLPLRPVRGQITYLKTNQALENIKSIICGSSYLTPKIHNTYCLGATFNRDDRNNDIRQVDHQTNIDNMTMYMPGNPAISVSNITGGRAAVRCIGPDRLPIAGPIVQEKHFRKTYADLCHGKPAGNLGPPNFHPNLFVSTAHGSRGLSSALLAAQTILAIATGTVLPIDLNTLEHILPARILTRELRKLT